MDRASSGESTFRYKPLDHSVDCIRLLALYPYDKRTPEIIKCELDTVTFLEKPKYEALSYTWGDSKATERIWLNGHPFAIQENLYNALDNLRPTGTRPRILWADAICIDQDSLDERKRQVGLMDYIFTRASTVLIWLGRGSAGVQRDFSQASEVSFTPWSLYQRVPSRGRRGQSLDKHQKMCPNWQHWVYTRSYWTRLWVIQEIGLSKDLRVCIGRHSRSWDSFLRCLKINKENTDSGHKYEYGLIQKLDEKRKGRHGSNNRLERLLEDFQYAGCKDRRDKVYGLLGLAYDCQDGSIEPDYTKPLFDLYTDVLSWFYYPRLLPVGDLESAQHIASHAYDRAMRIVRFSHLVQSLLGFPICPEIVTQDIFTAVAAVGGEILHLGPTYEEMYSSSILYKDWRLSFDAYYASPADRLQLREINEAYDAFLLKHSEWISHGVFAIDPEEMYSRGTLLEDSWESIEADWSSRQISGVTRWRSSSGLPTISYRSEKISNPRMFLGSNLLLGSAPAEAQEGDVICLFWNIGIVALLREEDRPADSRKYRVIGKLYLSTGRLQNLKPVYQNFIEARQGSETMLIEMDIKTLSILTRPPRSPNSHR